jgi:para-aminobenzoate synthetase/4-amino-4-deoxychorismate lyase
VLARGGALALEAAPLPPPSAGPVTCLALPLPVVPGDWRLRHKSTDRGFYEAALACAREHGAGEAIFVRDDGQVTEGSFTNMFVERDGMLLTPPVAAGLLPGILRRALLDEGKAREAPVMVDDLAGGFFIGNALRGLIAARLADEP